MRILLRRFLLGSLLLVFFLQLSAQSQISGRITDNEGEGLVGVTIRIKGTSTGTTTDYNGDYQLSVKQGDVLLFSYVGFKTTERVFSGESVLNVELELALDELDEVVVVGYGTQQKSDFTGATSVLSTKDVDLQPVQRVENVLMGKVSGVVVQQSSGAPGAVPKVNIRGFTGNPTYVIDGFIDADINAINPSDIESITVLKDASATAIYGSRGADGVILVTTKRGNKSSPLKVDADYYHTISHLADKLELLNPLLYMQIVNQKLDEAGANEQFSDEEINAARNNPNLGTDWQDEIFRTTHSDNFNVNLSKGWKNTGVRFSLGARQDEGIVLNTDYSRFTSRLNVTTSLSEKLKLNVIGGYTSEKNHNNGTSDRSDGSNPVVDAATVWSPNLPIFDPNTGDYQGFVGYGATVQRNPLYLANEIDANGTANIFNGNISLERQLGESFKVKASYGIQYAKREGSTFRRYEPATQGDVSSLSSSENMNSRQQWNLQGDYNTKIGENHTISVTAVGEVLDREAEVYRYLNTYNVDDTPGETLPANDPYDYTNLGQVSFLTRANYDYKNKLLFTGSVRWDASSRLAEDNRWDEFFSGAVAYRISEEAFLQGISFLEDMKLRVGYGEVGNVNSIQHVQTQNLTNPDVLGYVFYDNIVSAGEGFTDNGQRANPSLTWETAKTWNTGMDMILWEGQIELNVDYYEKITENSHFPNPVPAFLGGGSIQTNSGKFKNSGIELALTHQLSVGSDITIRNSVNFTFNQSEVLQIPEDSLYRGSLEDGFDQQSHVLIQGQQVGQLWGYRYLGAKTDGSSQIEGEVAGLQVGDAIYQDLNGDGQISIDDMTVIGNGHPNFTWGFNSFISYKNLTLNVFIQGVHGMDTYNLPKHGLLGGGAGVLDATSSDILNSVSFSPNAGNGTLPALNANYRAQSSLFVEDASFIRLRNITLGYTLPAKVSDKLKLTNLRVYGGVQNLITITKYTGYDPESKSGGLLTPGIDRGSFPIPRTYTLGLNLSF